MKRLHLLILISLCSSYLLGMNNNKKRKIRATQDEQELFDQALAVEPEVTLKMLRGIILQHNTNPEEREPTNSWLLEGARTHNAQQVTHVLLKNANINTKDENGLTPIMHAALYTGKWSKRSALGIVYGKQINTVETLLKANPDLTLKNNKGHDVFDVVMNYDDSSINPTVIDMLIKKANIAREDFYKRFPNYDECVANSFLRPDYFDQPDSESDSESDTGYPSTGDDKEV